MRIRNTATGAFAILMGLAAGSALAIEQCDATTLALLGLSDPAVSSSGALAASDAVFGAPIGDARLAAQRGGQDLIVNEQRLKATLTDNAASNLTTGNNVITDGAFVGNNGIPMLIQNTGNNVVIQNATILNLNLK